MDGIERSIHEYEFTIRQLLEEAARLIAEEELLDSNDRHRRGNKNPAEANEVSAPNRTAGTRAKRLMRNVRRDKDNTTKTRNCTVRTPKKLPGRKRD